MSAFTPTNRLNDCPICGDISRKCRTKNDGGQEFALCVTEAGSKLFDIVSGYKCIKTADSGRWATFTPDDSQPQLSQEERQQKRHLRDAEKARRFMGGLSALERDRNHAQLVSQLDLHPTDRADLERRGLPASVIETFASVSPWQRLSIPVDANTPGTGNNGGKLNTKYFGCLVPAKNLEGQVTGFQIRNRANGEKDDKYVWLSGYSNPANLQNGELPLTFSRGSGRMDNGPVYLAEGLLKPSIASLRHDISVIGAAGGMFASSPKQFADWVSRLTPSSLVLCPDKAAIANPDVMREYKKLNVLVESTGRQLQVLWWGQFTKTDADIDEITPAQFEQATLLSWAEFLAKDKSQRISAPLSETGTEKLVVEAKCDRPVASVKELAKEAQSISKVPDFEFSKGYLGEQFGALPVAEKEKTILMQVGKGGGKTTAIVSHCQKAFRDSGQRTTALTYRDALARKHSEEIGLGYRTNQHPGGMSICLDSAHPTSSAKFKADEHRDDILLFDEAVSVARHGIFSSTCKKERGHILPEVAKAIYNATDPQSNGQLVLSDADLDPKTIEFFLSFAHPEAQKPFFIRQETQAKEGNVIRYHDSDVLLGHALATATQGDRIWMCVTGQKETSGKGTKGLLDWFVERGVDKNSILVLDSETIKTIGHPAYGFLSMEPAEQQELLRKYQIVLATSAVEAGVSIDLYNGFYKAVYGLFTGVVAPSAARQSLSRVRDFTVDRHVFAADRGLPGSFIASGETTVKALMESQAKKTQELRAKMADECFTWAEDEKRPAVMVEAMAFWATAAAEHNRQMLKYADHVFEGLAAEGWNIVPPSAPAQPMIKHELREGKEKRHEAACERIATAEPISDSEADEINLRGTFEEGDIDRLRKHAISKLYETHEISPDLVKADDEGIYSNLKTLYLLTIGQVYEGKYLSGEIASLKGAGGDVFSPDIDQRNSSGKRELLRRIGIPKLLKFNSKFWKGDETVQRVWANIRANRKAIEKMLGIQFKESKAIGAINKILFATIGTRLQKTGEKLRHGRGQSPVYQFEGLPFQDVLGRWLERDHKKAAKYGELIDYSPLLNGQKMPTLDGQNMPTLDGQNTGLEMDTNQLNLGEFSVEQPTTEKMTEKMARPTKEQAIQAMENCDLKTLIESFLLGELGQDGKARYSHWLSTLSDDLKTTISPATQPATIAETEPAEPQTNGNAANALTDDETTLMFRMAYCQSFSEYAKIRAELEEIHPNFESRCWPLLSAESRNRICSFPVPGVVAA